MSRRQWSQLLRQAAASRHDMARTFRTTAQRRHAEAMRAPPQDTHPEALPPRAEQSAQPWNARAHRRRSAVQWKVATKNPSPSNEAPCDMRSLRFRLFAQSMTQAAPIVSNSSGIRHYAPAQWRSGSTAAWAVSRDCRAWPADWAPSRNGSACAGDGSGDSARLPCMRGQRPGRRSR